MLQINQPLLIPFFLLLLLTTATTASTASFSFFSSYSRYKTVVSLSHSLLTRVSNLRAARGDVAGANRTKLMAEKLEKGLGLGFWGLAWSVGWDYAKNYAWRDLDYRELYGVVSDLNELARFLGELTRAESEVERATWIARNYSNILRLSKSVLQRFMNVSQSGALKEAAEMVRREVVDGGLLRDCLELGSDDLKDFSADLDAVRSVVLRSDRSLLWSLRLPFEEEGAAGFAVCGFRSRGIVVHTEPREKDFEIWIHSREEGV